MLKNILLITITIVVFGYFSTILFSMQLVKGGEYYLTAISNNFSKKIILPQRGELFDEEGKLLAENLLNYEVLLSINTLSKKELEDLVGRLSDSDIFKEKLQIKDLEDLNKVKPVERRGYLGYLILKDLNLGEYNKFFEEYGNLKGLIGIESSIRHYRYPFEFAHLIGYLGSPNTDELEANSEFSKVDLIGKTGIEEFYNEMLIGKAGERFVYKSNEGSYEENVFRKSQKGDALYLTIKSDWQFLLYRLLERQMIESKAYGAAAVIMESKTGEIKSLVSLPSFDPNQFNKGISVEDFSKLNIDPSKPLLNKVLSVNISPGSTIKPLIALFALKNEVIDPTYKYTSRGCEDLGTGITFCEADSKVLGEVDLAASIFRSSNLYYCSIARRYEEKFEGQGVQFLLDDFDSIGFLEKSGIDLKGEVLSTLPSPERIQRNQGRDWSYGDACNMVIGQGDLTVTPIKLVMIASLINNDGVVYQPYLLKKVENEKGNTVVENFETEKYELKMEEKEYFNLLKRAMKRTILESTGSAASLKGLSTDLAIKTGSADAKEVLDDGTVLEGAHSWVMGNFKIYDKDYSFAFVQLYGGRGFQTLPVVGNFLNCLDNDSQYPDCIKY